MSFLIDTNILSEIRKGRHCDKAVRDWWQSTEAHDQYLSVMVAGEIQRGIDKLMRTNPARAKEFQAWLDSVVLAFGGRVLAIDLETARTWGMLTSKRSLPLVDAVLAATSLVHDLTLVTRNTRNIRDTGIRYLNPFDY